MALIDREAVKKVFEDFGKPLVMAPGFAARQIDAIPAIDRWISVEERLPESKGKYLVFAVGSYFGYSIETAYWTPKYDGFEPDLKGRAIWYSYDGEYGDLELDGVAYWMHLPDVPKKEGV